MARSGICPSLSVRNPADDSPRGMHVTAASSPRPDAWKVPVRRGKSQVFAMVEPTSAHSRGQAQSPGDFLLDLNFQATIFFGFTLVGN